MNQRSWPPDAVRKLLVGDPRFEQVPADGDYARVVAAELVREVCYLALSSPMKGRWR